MRQQNFRRESGSKVCLCVVFPGSMVEMSFSIGLNKHSFSL